MRYLPLTVEDRRAMLGAIGVPGVDDLYRDVPTAAVLAKPIDLPPHAGELAVERQIAAMAAKNLSPATTPCFLGAGAYRHHVPASVDHLIQRSEFLTSYTPYQPEISQGTLQYLFEFQTQVALITGMDVANASMYDGATSCAEAVLMAQRVTRRRKAVLSGNLHPHWRDTTTTLVEGDAITLPPAPTGEADLADRIDGETACIVVQNPDVFGHVRDLSTLAAACHAKGALLVVAVAEVVSLGLLTPPGAMGADIVVAEGQSLGVPLSFGGPYVGLFATRDKYVRQMPGRLCGETVDAEGRRGYVLTLSTREQHIRREKATSNICTNAGLCALAFCIHLTLLGEAGFTRLAELNHAGAVQLVERLEKVKGVEILSPVFFNEFAIRLPRNANAVVDQLAAMGVLGGVPATRLFPDAKNLDDILVLAVTETVTPEDCARLEAALQEVLA